MAKGGFFSKIFGKVSPQASLPFSVAVGTAVGGGVSGALTPGVQALINEANAAFPFKPPAYGLLADGVAQGQVDEGWAKTQALHQGIPNDAFDRLVDIANTGPGAANAFELWRRNLIDDGAFGRALKRQAIEDEWIGPLRQLKNRLLSPAELALARQQNFMTEAEATAEAGLQGITPERAEIQFELAGLPPGVMDSLGMLRRRIIDEPTFRQIVAEGHTKTKYTDALLQLEQRILSATQAASLWLKGWITEEQAKAIGADNGFDAATMELLYKNQGRPATAHQVHIGYARGAKLPGAANEREAIARSVAQSNIRTEYTDLLYASRESLPSPFVLLRLAAAGAIERDDVEKYLLWSGWPPDLATKTADFTAKPAGGTAASKWGDRAATRLFTLAWNNYLAGEIDAAQLNGALDAIGATDPDAARVVRLADDAKALPRKPLTQAQVLKLYKAGDWTRDQAQAELEAQGMAPDDATALLDAV